MEKGRISGPEVTIYADLAIKENLTYEEYLKAIEQLKDIESGTHHVESGGLITATASTAKSETFFLEDTKNAYIGSTSAGDGKMRPLVVDIERGLRPTPIDPSTGKPISPELSKEGFLPLGGSSGTSIDSELPPSDPLRFKEASEPGVASNSDWRATNPPPGSDPFAGGKTPARDQINKFFTPKGGPFPTGNVDRAAVSNDTILVHPAGDSATPNDSDTVPRSVTP